MGIVGGIDTHPLLLPLPLPFHMDRWGHPALCILPKHSGLESGHGHFPSLDHRQHLQTFLFKKLASCYSSLVRRCSYVKLLLNRRTVYIASFSYLKTIFFVNFSWYVLASKLQVIDDQANV